MGASRVDEATPASCDDSRMDRIVVNDYAIAFRAAGDGPPLVLIHGSLSDLRSFDQQLAPFAAQYETFTPSLRHCWPDAAEGDGADFTVEQHAADIAAFIAQRCAGAAHVVGHSRGGAVALQLAMRHPATLRSLVLADPGGLESLLPETAEGRELAASTAAMFGRLRDDLAAGDAVAAARNFADALGGPGAWDRRSGTQQAVMLDNIATGPWCAQRPRFPREALASLAVPMLLVMGANSPARYRPMLEALRSCNPNVRRLATIDGAAHAMHREQPGAFNAAVLEFLATV